MSRFNSTLKNFRRRAEVEVQVGDTDFIVTVRKASMHNQEFRSKAEAFRNKRSSGSRKKVHVGSTSTALSGTNDPKQDAEFFFEVFVVTWRGLKDDSGKEVEPSVEAAIDLFSTDEGQVMMELILGETTKDENFLVRDQEEQDIAGESSPSSNISKIGGKTVG